MKVFYRRKGAISVFLSLILLPTLLFAGLVTDAARIYGSRSLVSGAGELAMNAGLSHYDVRLKDAYGLMVMSESPEELSSELEQYFVNTLRASGLEGSDEVSSLIDLRCDSFQAYNVDGSQIYQTEAEKQQILEYMKYRAPVCMGEALWKKLDQIRDAKKTVEATNAQLDFADSMEDLQKTCEEANQALAKYCQSAELGLIFSNDNLNLTMESVKAELEEGTVYLFMADTIRHYELYGAQDTSEDFLDSMKHFNEKVPELQTYTEDTLFNYFDRCLGCLYEQKNIPAANLAQTMQERIDGAESDEAKAEIEKIYKAYTDNKKILDQYILAIDKKAASHLNQAQAQIQVWYETIHQAELDAGEVLQKLEALRQQLGTSRSEYEKWNTAIGKLSDEEVKKSMGNEAKQYSDFMNEENLNALVGKMEKNRDWLLKALVILPEVTYCGEKLYNPISSMSPFQDAVSAADCFFTDSTKIRETAHAFTDQNYQKQFMPDSVSFQADISSDPFYKELQKHCQAQPETEKSRQDKATTDALFGQCALVENSVEIASLEDADWGSVTLPSVVLAQNSPSGNENDQYVMAGGGTDRNGRKEAISNAKKTMDGISGFLDTLETLLQDGLENIYIMEYGMQMFSYYTVDKDSNGAKIEGPITSLSDDDLTKHAQYRSEVEYILWGNQSAKQNVNNTRLLLYGIRMLFNMVYAFSDSDVALLSRSMAAAMSCGVPFLVPVFSVLVKIAIAGAETVYDVEDLMLGKDVPFIKKSSNCQVMKQLGFGTGGRQEADITFGYQDYLSVFLLVKTFGPMEKTTLARIADCIQLNTDMDIINGYTMLAVHADVEAGTTFLKKAAALPDGGGGTVSDRYHITYKSVLGY